MCSREVGTTRAVGVGRRVCAVLSSKRDTGETSLLSLSFVSQVQNAMQQRNDWHNPSLDLYYIESSAWIKRCANPSTSVHGFVACPKEDMALPSDMGPEAEMSCTAGFLLPIHSTLCEPVTRTGNAGHGRETENGSSDDSHISCLDP